MILLLTFEEDPQGNALVDALDELGFSNYLRLDLGRVFQRNAVDLRFEDGSWRARIHFHEAPELALDSGMLRTVYLRRYLHPSLHRQIFYPSVDDFDTSQAYTAVEAWISSLPAGKFPLGAPASQRAAENKFKQLEVAAACGFATLPTLFCTDPGAALAFAGAHNPVVIKTLGTQSYFAQSAGDGDSMSIFGAACVDADTLRQHLEGRQRMQVYTQKAVPKVAEWRITSIAGEHIPCRIDTRDIPNGGIDYRPHVGSLPHAIVDLPDGLRGRLDAYLEAMHLQSGCFDFAELADGSLVFFECNPVGEWLWIQRRTGHPIAEEFARRLIRHHEEECC